jgi:hypothetical protein
MVLSRGDLDQWMYLIGIGDLIRRSKGYSNDCTVSIYVDYIQIQ